MTVRLTLDIEQQALDRANKLLAEKGETLDEALQDYIIEYARQEEAATAYKKEKNQPQTLCPK